MRAPGLPTFDQLRVFVHVADLGSFSRAAEQLSRSQSVISYTIAKLEAQLNLALFDRSKRKLTLTEAGTFLLADARDIGQRLAAMRARTHAFAESLEATMTVAVDVLYPRATLCAILRAFHLQFPALRVRLRVESADTVGQLVTNRVCMIGISGPDVQQADVLARRSLPGVPLLAVAAPVHPLAQIGQLLPGYALREHVQLVLSGPSRMGEDVEAGVQGKDEWRVDNIETMHLLLCAGLGWGYMPADEVGADLDAGRLIQLPLADGACPPVPMQIIYRNDSPPGKAANWLIQQFLVPDTA
jgi:DNA-binding transcriptional LysR family regulator